MPLLWRLISLIFKFVVQLSSGRHWFCVFLFSRTTKFTLTCSHWWFIFDECAAFCVQSFIVDGKHLLMGDFTFLKMEIIYPLIFIKIREKETLSLCTVVPPMCRDANQTFFSQVCKVWWPHLSKIIHDYCKKIKMHLWKQLWLPRLFFPFKQRLNLGVYVVILFSFFHPMILKCLSYQVGFSTFVWYFSEREGGGWGGVYQMMYSISLQIGSAKLGSSQI